MVSTRFFLSQSIRTLSSRLLVAVTAASSSCHAVHDAAACVSTLVYGRPALAARSLNALTKPAAPGALMTGACSSNIVAASAFLVSGDVAIGPGAGYM